MCRVNKSEERVRPRCWHFVHGRNRRFARQPVMGHLMVMLSLKLCNSNCFVSRCTQKIDPLSEDFEDMQSIFTKGHMKSRLDGRPSTFPDSSFGTVCLFCLLTAPHGQI